MRVSMWIFATVILSAVPILSGQTFGEITGEVRDSTGAVVTSAAVTVTNEATGASRKVVTNEVGVYTFPSLPPGVYDLKVIAQGFQVVNRPGIDLQVQQTARIDFTLSVGEVTETIQVTGGAPLLTTEDATVGTVI